MKKALLLSLISISFCVLANDKPSIHTEQQSQIKMETQEIKPNEEPKGLEITLHKETSNNQPPKIELEVEKEGPVDKEDEQALIAQLENLLSKDTNREQQEKSTDQFEHILPENENLEDESQEVDDNEEFAEENAIENAEENMFLGL